MIEPVRARKRPVEVEAVLYTGHNATEVYDWMKSHDPDVRTGIIHDYGADSISVRTSFGDVVTPPGAYILRGADGEFYPCPAHVFVQTYELIED